MIFRGLRPLINIQLFRIVVFICTALPLAYGARIPSLEDEVANTIVRLRQQAHLSKLTRIRYRRDLQALTCTVAEQNNAQHLMWAYETDHPAEPTPVLKSLILTKPAPKGYPPIARYAVAVWSAQRSEEKRITFWVGVQTYSTPGWEFFDNTFTDDLLYRNDWKKQVSPSCKTAR